MISDFLYKCFHVLLRLVVSVVLSIVLIFALTALAGTPASSMPKEIDDQLAYMMLGCSLGGVIYAANSVLFDLLEGLNNKFFNAVKFGIFALIWGAVIVLQIYLCFPVENATYLFTEGWAWLLNGLKYSLFISPVVGVLFAHSNSKSGDISESIFETILPPLLITLIGVGISIALGALVTFVPFLSSFIHYLFILLSNGVGVFLIAKSGEWPYIITERESRRAMREALSLPRSSGGYSGGNHRETVRSSGDISRDMYSICQSYGGLQTFPSGHINVSITYSMSGHSISFTVSAKVTVDSSERDPYNIRSFKSDAERTIRSIASDVKYAAEQAANSSGGGQRYYVSVYVNAN